MWKQKFKLWALYDYGKWKTKRFYLHVYIVTLFEFINGSKCCCFICIVRWVFHRWQEIRLCCNISAFQCGFHWMGKTGDRLLSSSTNHVHWIWEKDTTREKCKITFSNLHLMDGKWRKYFFGMFMPSKTLSIEPMVESLPLRCDQIRCCGKKSFVIWNTFKWGHASVHGCAFNSWFWLKRLWAIKQSAYMCEHRFETEKNLSIRSIKSSDDFQNESDYLRLLFGQNGCVSPLLTHISRCPMAPISP